MNELFFGANTVRGFTKSNVVPQPSVLPRWWRLTLIALASLILTACSAFDPPSSRGGRNSFRVPADTAAMSGAAELSDTTPNAKSAVQQTAYHETQPVAGKMTPAAAQLPPQAFTGRPGDGYSQGATGLYMPGTPGSRPLAMPGCASCVPNGPGTLPWAPPGIARPWPPDEYICDGGDQGVRVRVAPDFHVDGLDPEDTVVHYDTLDGHTVVEPSNRVCVYAPRFAAVRKVGPIVLNQQNIAPGGTHAPLPPLDQGQIDIATTTLQELQLQNDIGTKKPTQLREREPVAALINELSPVAFVNRFKAYENLQIIRTGIAQQDEKAYLAQKALAAVVWAKDDGAQVIIDEHHAQLVTKDQTAQMTYTVDMPGNPKLRVCKVASTDLANSGDIIDFTIRYDNTGNQKIGNVTILDSLTPRLEYVPNSAQSSQKANFSTKVNEGDSLVLRWEITNPLQPGQGGVLRFQCKVR